MTATPQINYKPPTKNQKVELYGKKIKLMKFQRSVCEPISKGMTFCGTRTIGEVIENKVSSCEIALNQNGYRLSGLATCKSAWCVRCCTMKIGDRVARIKQGIEHFFDEKRKVYFLTLTCKRSGNFKTQIQFLKKGWKRLQNRFNYLKRKGHSFEYVKSFDITFKPYDDDEFHPHLHICLVTDSKLRKASILKAMETAWLSMPEILGVYAGEQGQKLEELRPWNYKKRATYLGKNSGLAFELGSPATKKGKKKSFSLAELIEKAASGDNICKAVYLKFLRTIKGQNTINFSRGWTKLIKEEKEPDDYTIPLTIQMIKAARIHQINLHAICIALLSSVSARMDFKHLINHPSSIKIWFEHYKIVFD